MNLIKSKKVPVYLIKIIPLRNCEGEFKNFQNEDNCRAIRPEGDPFKPLAGKKVKDLNLSISWKWI